MQNRDESVSDSAEYFFQSMAFVCWLIDSAHSTQPGVDTVGPELVSRYPNFVNPDPVSHWTSPSIYERFLSFVREDLRRHLGRKHIPVLKAGWKSARLRRMWEYLATHGPIGTSDLPFKDWLSIMLYASGPYCALPRSLEEVRETSPRYDLTQVPAKALLKEIVRRFSLDILPKSGGLLTAREVAKRLGKSDRTIRNWARAGKLRAKFTVGPHQKRRLAGIPISAVDEFLRA